MSVRVLIAEGDPELRGLFKSHVQTLPGFEVVGHATDERAAVELCDEYHPEILLLGLGSDRPIDELIAEIRRTCPDMKVVVVTSPSLSTTAIPGADVVLNRPMGSDTFSSTLLELVDQFVR